MVAHWQAEKHAIAAIREEKERLEQARLDAERAEREGDLERAAQLRYGHLPVLEQELAATTARLAQLQTGGAMLKEEVDAEDVAEIVAKWTGVPVSRLMEGEMAKLVRLEEVLHERSAGRAQAWPTRTALSARSSSWDPLVWARPSWRVRSRSCSSTTSTRWSESTCRSTWRSTLSRASSERLPVTSGTRRVASSQRPCVAARTP